MRRLLKILPLTLLATWWLSGCVTHYYPAYGTAPQASTSADVVYGNGDVAASVAVRYYPWWSLDYLYLGYGYPGSGLSIGFSWGFGGYYSPWYSPWYDRYRFSAWYAPVWYAPAWYGPSYGWHDPYWHHRYHHHYRPYPRGGHHPRYVHDGYRPPRRGHGAWDGVDDRIYDRERMVGDRGPGRGESRPVDTSRYVSVASRGERDRGGMEVRNAANGKVGRSRTGPVETYSPGVSLASTNPARSEAGVVSRRPNGAEVRSRAGTERKPVASRTQPVSRGGDASVSLSPATRIEPATWTANGNRTVRSRAERKVTASRTQPAGRSAVPSSRRPVAAAAVPSNRGPSRPTVSAPPRRSAPRYEAPRASRGPVSAPPRSSSAPRSAPPRAASPRPAPPPAASPPPSRSVSAPSSPPARSAPRGAPKASGRRGGSDRRR